LSNIIIKDREFLIRTLRTISWMDNLRWDVSGNYNLINFFRKDLTSSEKVLTHWICYIVDRQMPFEVIWDKAGYIFSQMVYEYSRTGISIDALFMKYYESFSDKKEETHYRFKSSDGVLFASRFITDDYQNILQTFKILSSPKYQRNIIRYITEIINKFITLDDILSRIACALNLLSYQLDNKKDNSDNILNIINDDALFNYKLNEFKKNSTENKKRLWCCVRDYKKGIYNDIFTQAITETNPKDADLLIKKWNELPMDQIELPGDVWNNSPLFRGNLISKLINTINLPATWKIPKIIREIYSKLSADEIGDFYPEQFDVTFDFVPRMCNKQLCNVCLFGQKGVESICISNKDKYCPIALVSCGYIANCVGEEKPCIIRDKISQGICSGIDNFKLLSHVGWALPTALKPG
jgi:hypothetical protein